jgi:hypothetical protein
MVSARVSPFAADEDDCSVRAMSEGAVARGWLALVSRYIGVTEVPSVRIPRGLAA